MISFLTYAYNEGKFIDQTIKSVLCLNIDMEYILIDDNSNDETWEIMQDYAHKDSRVKAYKNPKKGKNSALNCGITYCSGDWVTVVAGDDLFETDNLKYFQEEMEKYDPLKKKVFVAGLVRRFSDSDHYKEENGIVNAFPQKNERRASTIGFASRKMVDSMFPIPESYPNEDSWESMYYYYFADAIVNIPRVCINYRIHDNNSINHNDRSFQNFSDAMHVRCNQQMDFIEKYRDNLSEKEITYLKNEYKLEEYRYEKKYFRLMFVPVSLPDRLRALLMSNEILKKYKYKLTKYVQQKVQK